MAREREWQERGSGKRAGVVREQKQLENGSVERERKPFKIAGVARERERQESGSGKRAGAAIFI